MGVLGLFDNPDIAIKRLTSFLRKKKGSKLILINAANVYSIDTILRYKHSDSKNWEYGQNIFSINTIRKIVFKNKLKFLVKKAKLIQIKKRKDVMRSWTVELNLGGGSQKKTRYLLDGMGRLKHTYIFTLTK